jgi:hypothetical protein
MLNEDYRDMLHALSDEKVKFLLVGAYALAAHGYPRATMDIDIWVRIRGTLVQIQLGIAREKILTAACQYGYRFKQKLTLPSRRSRIDLYAPIAERSMT